MLDIKTITCYVEKLYHFKCLSCGKWWNVADGRLEIKDVMFCTHCGQKHRISDFEIGEDKLTEIDKTEDVPQLELFSDEN